MFTKVLIFALLGASLVLANPVKQQEDQSLSGKFDQWVHKVSENVKEYFQESKDQVDDYLHEFKEKAVGLGEVGKEQYATLKKKFEELTEKAKAAIKNMTNADNYPEYKKYEYIVYKAK